MNNSQDLTIILMMNTLGLSILFSAFRSAAWTYTLPEYHPKTASDSLTFIEGTGLELTLQTYNLMYDANKLRNTFFSMVGDHGRIN